MSFEFLWYIPNQVTPGHRGEPVTADHNSLETLTSQAKALEHHGWKGALFGAGWGRPDTFTVATALAAQDHHVRAAHRDPARATGARRTLPRPPRRSITSPAAGSGSTSSPARTTSARTAT